MRLAIVILYYKKTFFKETLPSIASHTCKDFVLYIGDDANLDATTIIINEFDNFINIVYKRFEENIGANTTKIAEGLAIPRDTLNKILSYLIELNKIERHGGKKFGGYFANNRNKAPHNNGTLNGILSGTLNEKQLFVCDYIKADTSVKFKNMY